MTFIDWFFTILTLLMVLIGFGGAPYFFDWYIRHQRRREAREAEDS